VPIFIIGTLLLVCTVFTTAFPAQVLPTASTAKVAFIGTSLLRLALIFALISHTSTLPIIPAFSVIAVWTIAKAATILPNAPLASALIIYKVFLVRVV
jgi:hypothetical protein